MMRPKPCCVHMRQRGPDQQERRLHHERQHEPEAVRREFCDRADALDAGVVDQDVGLEPQLLQRGDVEKVDRPGLSTDLAGDRLGADVVDVGHGDDAPRAASSRAQAAPMPLAPPVTSAVRPSSSVIRPPPSRARRGRTRRAISRSIPLVSRMNSTATSVTPAATAR